MNESTQNVLCSEDKTKSALVQQNYAQDFFGQFPVLITNQCITPEIVKLNEPLSPSNYPSTPLGNHSVID
jgi:hypothetical protein